MIAGFPRAYSRQATLLYHFGGVNGTFAFHATRLQEGQQTIADALRTCSDLQRRSPWQLCISPFHRTPLVERVRDVAEFRASLQRLSDSLVEYRNYYLLLASGPEALQHLGIQVLGEAKRLYPLLRQDDHSFIFSPSYKEALVKLREWAAELNPQHDLAQELVALD